MKKLAILPLIVLTSGIFWGCTGSLFTITPEGDSATIAIEQRPDLSAKLLAINRKDSVLYVSASSANSDTLAVKNDEIIGIKLDAIHSITIQNYTNKEYVMPWIAFQAVPTVLLVVAASSAGVENLGRGTVILSLPSLFSGLLLFASTPKDPTITTTELDELNKYTRFPLGLSNSQLQKLIRMQDQKELRIIGQNSSPISQVLNTTHN